MLAVLGYDCMLWIMGHNLSDDGTNQCIIVIGLEKRRVFWESGHDSVCQWFERAWMSCSIISVDQCQDGFVTQKQGVGYRAELKWPWSEASTAECTE